MAKDLAIVLNNGSINSAVVTAMAEPNGTVLTGDPADLRALAEHTSGVTVERI